MNHIYEKGEPSPSMATLCHTVANLIDFKPTAFTYDDQPLDYRTAGRLASAGYQARQVARSPNWVLLPGTRQRCPTRLFPTLKELEIFLFTQPA